MRGRPLLQKGIRDLETLFEKRGDEQIVLNDLLRELKHRKTKRAQRLMERVASILDVERSTTEPPSPGELFDGPEPLPESGTQKQKPNVAPVQQMVDSTTSTSQPFATKPVDIDPPSLTNNADSILTAWTAMEVLSPSNFKKPKDLAGGDRWRIANFKDNTLPWEKGVERSRPGYRLYYQIILGSIVMEPSVSALLKVYTDSRDERPHAGGEAVLASVMVDKEGRPVEEDSVSISSFGWGIPYAQSGQLEELGAWTQAEKALTKALSDKVSQTDEEGRLIPLTQETITGAYKWLLGALGLDQSLTKPPAFAVRTYQYYRIQDPPEALILNSFFLYDLAAAGALVREKRVPRNLQRYLGMLHPKHRRNLMTDKNAIEAALEPKKIPNGGWPANGRHPLVVLQQCAVNLALCDLERDGILAVNGPPGTGKTTLLRDVIAAVVTDRATVLSSYADPEKAFTHSGQKLKKGNAFVHLYTLDEKVRGFEVIVASSNNKAVENVSAELPGIDAIATDATGLRYFQTLSDNLLERESWGVIAAVLGNSANRAKFRKDFWWDEDYGLQTYLQHAAGNPKLITESSGDETIQRSPIITEQEDPPRDHDEALTRWRAVRQRFARTLEQTTAALNELQTAYDLHQFVRERYAEIAALEDQIVKGENRVRELAEIIIASEQEYREKAEVLGSAQIEVDHSLQQKPGLLRRLFHWSKYREWRNAHRRISERWHQAQDESAKAQAFYEKKRDEEATLAAELSKAKAQRDEISVEVHKDVETYSALAEKLGGTFIDDSFFERSHEDRQIAAPWLNDVIAGLRHELFEAAMAVHKAFVDAAAKPIRHNLNVLLDGFGTRSLGSSEKDALIPHLWATLFVVVPVVSTTFASVSRMFGRIEPETFGWLLIDEAGQALPQAAVGALMRTKRAVVVGDPVQIEPVVVLPDRLTEAICRKFGIDPLIYNAPAASAQTLADSATPYFGTFETQDGTREVGVPLLVHRRCSDPMFSISNAVAYENLMVQAKAAKSSPIRDALGPSHWIHVQGRAQEKWCPEEGDVVLELLRNLRTAGVTPDLYVVTPFVIVQNSLRDLLRSSGLLDGWVEQPERWVYEHVGTVHTVQGREAEAVIFVLGAPKPEQRGARGWAGGRPNLVNVATTRAKEVIYVVGNTELWKSVGVFQFLHRWLA